MNREVHVRFWERLEVKALRATRHSRPAQAESKSDHVRYALRVQPVDATQALNLCAGAWKFKVFRGRSLS
jgi:hypothetical protein